MAGRLRVIDFSDNYARSMLNQIFPQQGEKVRTLLITILAYEKAIPRKNGNRYFWVYKFHNKKIAVYFIMENLGDPYSKIQIKSIEELS